jgi:hypothetical protein
MRALSEAWDRLWFSRFDPHAAGVFRLFLGVTLVVYYAALSPHWERYFAADGMLSLDVAAPDRARYFSLFYWADGVLPARAFWWVGVVAAVCFALGLLTRLSTVVLFLMHSSMMFRNGLIGLGDDIVFRLLLFLGIFAPLNRSLAIDGWLRRQPAGTEERPAVWAVRLMQINIALVYVISVPHKLAEDEWRDGTAIYWTLVNDAWSRWPWPQLFYGSTGELLSAAATFGTIAAQAAFPLLVWFRRPRPYVLLAVAFLHLSIGILLESVLFFSLAMVCSFWLFVPGETTRRWDERLRRLGRKLIGRE